MKIDSLMEIAYLVVGLCFISVGSIIAILIKKPARSRKNTGKIIGYSMENNIFTPIFVFKSLSKNEKFGVWYKSSGFLNYSIGEKVSFIESSQFKNRLWLTNTKYPQASIILIVMGLIQTLIYFRAININPMKMIYAPFALGGMLAYIISEKYLKDKSFKEKQINEIYEEIKNKSFTMEVYNSLEQGNIKLEEREKLVQTYKIQKKLKSRFKNYIFLISFIAIITSIIYFNKRKNFLHNGITTKAKLIDFYIERSSRHKEYYPIYEFKLKDSTHLVRARYHLGSRFPSRKKDEIVEIIYSPDDHTDFLENEGLIMNYQAPITILITGIIFLITGINFKLKKIKL